MGAIKYKINKNGDTLLDSVYENRNLTDDYIDSLLYSTTFEDVNNYTNMRNGHELLNKTIEDGGDIGIIIDPDFDGYSSASIIYSWIYDYKEYDNVYYIIKEAKKHHGINKEVIDKVKENNFSLIICPDSSSNDTKEHKILEGLGCKVLVLDHHIYQKEETPAIIINNQDEGVMNKSLSGCGVTYKFVYYMAEKEGIDIGYNFLDLVACSLISDMCDMTSLENRYLFNIGSDIKNNTNELIKEFITDLKLKKKLNIESVAFGISPKFNAIIRLGDIKEREELFESLIGSQEEVEYKYRGKVCKQSIAKSILRCANRLKSKQKRMVESSVENLKILTSDEDRVLIIDADNIESEIRGLLANKLMSEYKRPVMMLSGGDTLRGSCRGVNSISFKDLLESSKLFNYCEGHSNACSCSINRSNLDKLIKYLNKELFGVDLDSATEVDYAYEGFMPLDDLLDLAELDELWCNTVKRPKLLVKNIKINSKDISKKGIDLSFKINDVIYRRDFCSKIFYEDLICIEENENIDKDLIIDIICSVKTFESGKSYINIEEFESCVDM